MRAWWTAATVAFGLALPAVEALPSPPLGFGPDASVREGLIETRFLDIPSAQSALDTTRLVAGEPHYAGTPGDYTLAVAMRDRLRAVGIPAALESFTARVDTPRELALELAPAADLAATPSGRRSRRPFPVVLDLAETPEPQDPATAARGIGLPFEAGSADGDVSAPLVYAGRGTEADYAVLAGASVDPRGAVVLVRTGAEPAQALVGRATERGAAGVILYADPADNRGPQAAVERGWLAPGIHVPVLPVAAANAQILLGALQGLPGPAGWTGALPVAYPVGRGPGRVHLVVKLNRKTTTVWNTVGTIAGSDTQRSLLLGAQRDAWVYGAGDDGAGVTTVLEVARGLGYLLQSGWRPRRTIVLAGWDAEVLGRAGSHAYGRAHRAALTAGCIADLEADEPVAGGGMDIAADPALLAVGADVRRLVRDPRTPAVTFAGGRQHADADLLWPGAGIPWAALHWTASFGARASSHDTLQYATLTDPQFALHRAAAQAYGLAVLRLADATVTPYRLSGYVAALRASVGRLAERARAAGVPLDERRLRLELDRLAVQTTAVDGQIGHAVRDLSDAQVAAVRRLNLLVASAAAPVGSSPAELTLTARRLSADSDAIATALASADHAAREHL